MKVIFTLILIILISYLELKSEFPTTVQVDSKGSIVQTAKTVLGAKYTISVEGTFSIWPQFIDCHGFDAAYVYEAPQEEIDGLRWPPQEIEILGNKIEIFKLPKWVGDPKLYQFPLPEISTPVIEISLEKQKGFRINGKPLPNLGFNSVDHKYQIELIGDGMPISFQIIDSNFSIIDGNTIPRYDDNCGSLSVHISEFIENDSILVNEICNSEFIDNYFHLYLNLYFKSIKNQNPENLLSNGATISLLFDNKEYVPKEINCSYDKIPSDIYFLLDNSGSMLAGETALDTIQRIDAAKSLIKATLTLLDTNDRLSLVSFNDNTIQQFNLSNLNDVNIQKIGNVLNDLKAGFKTDIIKGLLHLQTNINTGSRNPIIVILSDFADNSNDSLSNLMTKNINQLKTETILVNYALGGNQTDVFSNELLKNLTNNLKSVYVFESKDIANFTLQFARSTGTLNIFNCCDAIFEIDPCYFGKDTTITAKLNVTFKDSTYSFNQPIIFECKKSIYSFGKKNQTVFSMNGEAINLNINSDNNDILLIRITDYMGNIIFVNNYKCNLGFNHIQIPINKYYYGIYLISVVGNNCSDVFKFIKY